jgi:hypothetical protein
LIDQLQDTNTDEYSSTVLSLDSDTDPTKLLIDTDNSDLSEGELSILLHYKVSDNNSAFVEIILEIEAAAKELFFPFVPVFVVIEEEIPIIDESPFEPEPLF